MAAARLRPGAISESSSSHLPPNVASKLALPSSIMNSRRRIGHLWSATACADAGDRHEAGALRKETLQK
jgi:hypothetical protein